MLGLAPFRTSKKLTVEKAPTLLPPHREGEERTPRSVFLFLQQWDDLTEAADFHSEAFKAIDTKNPAVSRNDLIENFLQWALAVYWEENVGGKPKGDAERKVKLAAFVEKLKKQAKTAASKPSEK